MSRRPGARAFADAITVEALERDPYPIYARLRREAPVAWVPAVNMWLATGWEEATAVATDPGRFAADLPDSPVDRMMGTPNILTSDGPVHRELRQAVDPKLRPHVVEEFIEGLVAPIAGEILDALEPRREAELIAEFCEPVSVLSLRAVLGLHEVDADTLREWFHGLARGGTNFERDPVKAADGRRAARAVDERVEPIVARLEREPDGGLLAHMLHAGMAGGATRDRALVMPTFKVILLGGMQEPGHGLGSVVLLLLTHPDQLAEVRADPDALLAAAVEEGMRMIAPIGTQGRRVVHDTELGGARLPAGAPIAAVVASANRDPSRFPDPDRFDIHRERLRTATFGFGHHFCSGHAFARAQERIALRLLLERLPGLALDAARPPELRGWEFRAPRHLHVRW